MAVDELVALATDYPRFATSTTGRNCPASPSNPVRSASSTWPTTSSRPSPNDLPATHNPRLRRWDEIPLMTDIVICNPLRTPVGRMGGVLS